MIQRQFHPAFAGLLLALLVAPALNAHVADAAPATPGASNSTASAASTPSAPPTEASTANLRPHYVPGRVSRYDIWSSRRQQVRVTFMGQSEEIDSLLETTGVVTWRVDRARADGTATCVMVIDWIAATSKVGDTEPTHNDSRKNAGDTPAMHTLLKSMAGVPITVEMAADGSVAKVTGVDAVRQRAGDDLNVPDELDFVESASDLATIIAAQDHMAVNQSFKASAAWNHELGKLNHDIQFTLTSLEDIAGIPVATVTGAAKLKLDLDQAKLPKDGPRVDVKLTRGEATTQIMFDLSRREAVGRNSSQTTVLEAKISHEGQTVTRVAEETIQSQALRIAEK